MPKTSKAAEVKAAEGAAPLQYDVKVHSIRPEGSIRAMASVNINGSFAVRNVKVMEGTKGLFVSMPSYRTSGGEYKDICFPCTSEARKSFDSAVLGAYEQALDFGHKKEQSQEGGEPLQENQPVMGGM